jgi:hypothetical protein
MGKKRNFKTKWINKMKQTTQEKTIKKWYEEFPEPYRTQALANVKYPEVKWSTPLDALAGGFDWYYSPEGAKYWIEFSNILDKQK